MSNSSGLLTAGMLVAFLSSGTALADRKNPDLANRPKTSSVEAPHGDNPGADEKPKPPAAPPHQGAKDGPDGHAKAAKQAEKPGRDRVLVPERPHKPQRAASDFRLPHWRARRQENSSPPRETRTRPIRHDPDATRGAGPRPPQRPPEKRH